MSFQAHANAQGQSFDAICRTILADFDPPARGQTIPDVGIEVDCVVGEVWIEFKGSWRGDRPGLIRTDTLKKAIANGALASLCHEGPFVVMTSHLPAIGSQGDRMLAAAQLAGWLDDVFVVGDPTDMRRLVALCKEYR
jgi:hypothetical protein